MGAVIEVPARTANTVREGDAAAAHATGVKFLRYSGGKAQYQAGGGTYRFTSQL
jgi:hypothetical protein